MDLLKWETKLKSMSKTLSDILVDVADCDNLFYRSIYEALENINRAKNLIGLYKADKTKNFVTEHNKPDVFKYLRENTNLSEEAIQLIQQFAEKGE